MWVSIGFFVIAVACWVLSVLCLSKVFIGNILVMYIVSYAWAYLVGVLIESKTKIVPWIVATLLAALAAGIGHAYSNLSEFQFWMLWVVMIVAAACGERRVLSWKIKK